MLSVVAPYIGVLSVVMLSVIMLSVVMLSVIMLSVIMLSVIMLSVVMLSAIMLSAIMLSVIMLLVVMLSVIPPYIGVLSVIMLSVVAPFIVVLSVVMLSIVAPYIGVLSIAMLSVVMLSVAELYTLVWPNLQSQVCDKIIQSNGPKAFNQERTFFSLSCFFRKNILNIFSIHPPPPVHNPCVICIFKPALTNVPVRSTDRVFVYTGS
jgi:hypothetical protein